MELKNDLADQQYKKAYFSVSVCLSNFSTAIASPTIFYKTQSPIPFTAQSKLTQNM